MCVKGRPSTNIENPETDLDLFLNKAKLTVSRFSELTGQPSRAIYEWRHAGCPPIALWGMKMYLDKIKNEELKNDSISKYR